MNIVVLAGGTSTERDISIMTSVKVCESLRRNGHNANIIDVFFGRRKIFLLMMSLQTEKRAARAFLVIMC